jgi:hypothetical protein
VHVFQSVGDQPVLTDGEPNVIRSKDEMGDERARHDLDAAGQTQLLVRQLNGGVIHSVLLFVVFEVAALRLNVDSRLAHRVAPHLEFLQAGFADRSF